MISDWEELLENKVRYLSDVFLTDTQFGDLIEGLLGHPACPLAGLQYRVQCSEPFTGFRVGLPVESTPGIQTIRLKNNRYAVCQCHLWYKDASAMLSPDLVSKVIGLFPRFWKPDLRTASAGLPDVKREAKAIELAENTFQYHVRNGSPCSLLFCDLDNFGEVNRVIGHEAGDRVIKVFGATLEVISRKVAVVLHDGGDEFFLLMPGGGGTDALMLAYQVKRAVEDCDFGTGAIDLGVSIGISTTAADAACKTFAELKARADVALNEQAKKPRKGVARFSPEHVVAEDGREGAIRLDLAHCLVKSTMTSSLPFANVWLNCLSGIIRNTVAEWGFSSAAVQKAADDFIEWARLSRLCVSKSKSARAREEGFDASPAASGVDFAFAIAHGLLASALQSKDAPETPCSLILRFDEERQNLGLCLDDNAMWESAPGANLAKKYEIGSCWQLAAECDALPDTTSRAVLIRIGHEDPGLPSALFAEIIVVDDRPTRGGGLPDFWEATIARLIGHIVRNPNSAAVYLLGNHAYGAQTVERLSNVDAWKDHDVQIAQRTSMSVQNIRTASSFLTGKVHFPKDEEEIITHLANLLRIPHIIGSILPSTILQRDFRFLRRDVRMMDGMALGIEDGCRVRTISEAFPVVLEIARRGMELEIIRDQAGQGLRELVDFKVHLTNPTQDRIPTFYKQESFLLEEYFQKQFREPEGLFGKHFQQTSQLESVLRHIVKAVGDSTSQFATRRAILIVPHEVKEGEDIAPLGLVSVRIVPRFKQGRIILHYSYTWRTVEALVGFPYSIYGSVRFGEYLTEEVRRRLPADDARRVEVGEVSYMAHSLHIFMDDYGRNIAKKIVDDASY